MSADRREARQPPRVLIVIGQVLVFPEVLREARAEPAHEAKPA